MKLKFDFIELFKVKGVPIKIHFSLALAIVALLLLGFSNKFYLIGGICLFLIMLVHELGHMMLALRYNLKVHSIELYILHGWCHYQEADTDYENYIISWGGVIAQAFIFVPLFIISPFVGENLPESIDLMFAFLAGYNLLIALINLVPIEPLDGATCWKAILLFFKHGKINGKKKKQKKKKRGNHLKSVK